MLKRTGKRANFDDRQKIIDKLTMDVVTDKNHIWDSTEKGYKLTPERRKPPGSARNLTHRLSLTNSSPAKVYRDKAGNRAKYLGGGKQTAQ